MNNEKQIREIAQSIYDNNQTIDQFAVSQTPFHIHNGADSQKLPYMNLVKKIVIVPYTIFGSQAGVAINYRTFFTAPYPMTVIGITEVHAHIGSSGSAVTVMLEKLTGTTATASGIALLTTPFDIKGVAANIVQTGVLSTVLGAVQLLAGDRLGLTIRASSMTAVETVSVTVTLMF